MNAMSPRSIMTRIETWQLCAKHELAIMHLDITHVCPAHAYSATAYDHGKLASGSCLSCSEVHRNTTGGHHAPIPGTETMSPQSESIGLATLVRDATVACQLHEIKLLSGLPPTKHLNGLSAGVHRRLSVQQSRRRDVFSGK